MSLRDEETADLVIGGLVIAIVIAASVWLGGCGSALRVHATAATIAGPAIQAAADAVLDARAADLDGCAATPDPLGCLDERTARWAPAVAIPPLLVSAWVAWEAAIVAGLADPDGVVGPAIAAVLRLGAVWNDLVAFAATVGCDLPALPPELLTLLPGGGS